MNMYIQHNNKIELGLFFFVFIIGCFFVNIGRVNASAPVSGLVGYWNFDEGSGTTATDSSGSGNNGTLTNGPTWVAGKVGSGAISFDGSDDVVTVPYNASTFNFSSSNFTISTWVYINSQTNQTIWGSSDVFSNIEFSLVNQGPYNMAFWNGSEWKYSPTSIGTGWHHLTVVRNSSTGLSWYLDGVADGVSTFSSGSWSNGTQNRWIGDGFRSNLNGKIDEVRIYNRALTATEISDIYNDTGDVAPPPPPPTGDTTAPTIPTNLSVSAVSSSQINLSWTASTDTVGVTGYKIYRGGAQIGTSATNSYSDSNLIPNTLYSYTVSAYDSARNNSSQSPSSSATTQAIVVSGGIRQVGPGQTYTTIQSCINAAVAGDICNVRAGTYTEDIAISKAIMVQNNSGDRPNISGLISFASSNATIKGFSISKPACPSYLIYGSGLTNILVQDNIVSGCIAGAGIYFRNSTKITIDNNESYGNDVGIVLISAHSTDGTYTNGTTVSNNFVHDNHTDGLEIHAQYITITGNRIYDNIDTNWAANHPDGIQLLAGNADGYISVQHVRITNNTIRNHTQNIFAEGQVSGQSSDTQDISIWNNVVYNTSGVVNGVNMATLGGVNVLLKYVKDAWVYNNYFGYIGSNGNSIRVSDSYNGSVHIKNNIIQNLGSYGVYVEDVADISSGEMDYNNYHVSGSSSAVIWGSTFYTTVANFRSAVSSQESSGFDGNPFVASLPSPILQSNSPAINKGIDLGAIFVIDKSGTSRASFGVWDIGAYEYSGSTPSPIDPPPPPPPEPTPLKGDLNLDHIVNSLDFSLLNSRWNQNYSAYDLYVDGLINSLDYAILSSNWLKTW